LRRSRRRSDALLHHWGAVSFDASESHLQAGEMLPAPCRSSQASGAVAGLSAGGQSQGGTLASFRKIVFADLSAFRGAFRNLNRVDGLADAGERTSE
jgi:hypothetical protein